MSAQPRTAANLHTHRRTEPVFVCVCVCVCVFDRDHYRTGQASIGRLAPKNIEASENLF